MARSAIQIEGVDAVRKALRAVEGALDDLREVHADAAQIVEREARPNITVRTGLLASTDRSSGTKATGVVRLGSAAAYYAPYVYWPHPWLHDAAQARAAEVVATYEAGVDRIAKANKLKL